MSMRPVHFEIQAADPARCAAFYTLVFGWLIERWEGHDYWMCYTSGKKLRFGDLSGGPGIDGGILPRPKEDTDGEPLPRAAVNAFVTVMSVDNFGDIHDKILASGGGMVVPKFALVGMAWLGYYRDTEGNIFGIHQPDINAA